VIGTYESVLDTTSSDLDGSVHTAIHQTASMTAGGAADGTLAGTATYVFHEDYSLRGPGCNTAWSKEVSWDSAMTGTWHANADGTVAISLFPSSPLGPGIKEDLLCLGDITVPPLSLPFLGTLVNGRFDAHQDILPAEGAGTDWATWHMESTPRS
jgi:hypothetical protein